MKAVILAGGLGTRLTEYTETVPKPMVQIGDKPMLMHIMDYYAKFGVSDFVIAAGYKSEVIKQYFIDFSRINANFTVNLSTGDVSYHGDTSSRPWTVTVIDTGLNSMTGGRLLRLQHFLQGETFFLTYGDGVSDVNLDKLLEAHSLGSNFVTVTAVRPKARFGELNVEGSQVVDFKEKPQLGEGWINGGFFVVDPEFFTYLRNDETVLEQEPLTTLAQEGKLGCFLHEGFWQCMDTKRDQINLQNIWQSGSAPWA